MCSLAESDLLFENEDSLSECSTETLSECSNVCKKCRTADAVLTLRTKDRYCRDCFVTAVTHKFRSTLGKNRVMRHGDKVCVDFDGRQNSVALVKLINSSLDEKNVKRVVYTPVLVIIVDETNVERVEKIIRLAKNFGHEVYFVALASGLGEDVALEKIDDLTTTTTTATNLFEQKSSKNELSLILDSIKEDSARQFYLDCLKKRVLLKSAEILNCSKVFTSESSNTLAVNIISGIATGRGGHLTSDAGFQDSDCRNGIEILRPLKEFSLEEILLYNEGDLDIVEGDQSKSENSIKQVTENFILGLQEGFPATIPTICRTGDKMSCLSESCDVIKCALCGGKLDTIEPSGGGCTSLDATEFSRSLSMKGPDAASAEMLASSVKQLKIGGCQKNGCSGGGEDEAVECGEGGDSCCQSGSKKSDISLEDIKPHLCYGCRIVADKMSVYPGYLKNEVRTRINRLKMKNEIEDFLL